MFVDARSVESGKTLEADICIVGAGPAGISMALELVDSGLRVLLLESGDLEQTPAAQARAVGDRSGETYPPLERARVRAFGGSSRHWPHEEAMMARPLEPIDFEQRSEVPYSGWPFTRAHLEPFYQRAYELSGLRSQAFDLESWAGSDARSRLALSEDLAITSVIPSTPPNAFILAEQPLRRAENVTVALNATVVEITTNTDNAVTGLQVAPDAGRRFTARARCYVLAAGGIENPRLLLAGSPRHPDGLGNEHDLVGRFFMEHLWVQSGRFVPADRTTLAAPGVYELSRRGDERWRGVVGLTPEVVRREGLLNGVFFLGLADRYHTSLAAHSLAALRRMARHRPLQPHLPAHALTVLRDMQGLRAYWASRRGAGANPNVSFVVTSMSEQAPNPASRVALSGSQRDEFGVPRADLMWRRLPQDLDSVRRAQALLAGEVRRRALGRLVSILEHPAPVVYGTWHHMGTTRMHPDPRQGVTDANGRVHGVRNLYVTGSSVFPTVGYVNPTLTIVALAIRLAQHLRSQLGARGAARETA